MVISKDVHKMSQDVTEIRFNAVLTRFNAF